jgi:4'-phosphopantetheinyl transferase
MIIGPNEIHLWHVKDNQIIDPYLIDLYYQYMNDKERAQQKRFHFQKHKHQYLVTRALVRSVLSLYDDAISPENWEFKKNAYGKPYINNSSVRLPLYFNISHTENLIVLAVTLDCDLGIDVEYLPRISRIDGIVESFFSPSEILSFKALSEEKQQQHFFDLWTLKEAYIKACGMGLSIPLDEFSYDFSDAGKINIKFNDSKNDSAEAWHFWQAQPTPEHKLSLAMRKPVKTVSLSQWEIIPEKIIKKADYPISYGYLIHSETLKPENKKFYI